MKTSKMIALSAALALCISSCSKDENNEVYKSGTVQFFSGVSGYETRINEEGNKWTEGDIIGVFMTETNSSVVVNDAKNIQYKAASAASSTAFTPVNKDEEITYPEGQGAVDFIAYYPYNEAAGSFIYPVSLTNQATGFVKNDLLYAVSKGKNETDIESVSLEFKHQLTKLKLIPVLEEGLNNLTSVMIHSAATASFNLKTGLLEDISSVGQIIPCKNDDENAEESYEAILIPTELGTDNKVVFTVDGARYEWIMKINKDATDNPITKFEANTSYTFTIKIKKDQLVAELVSIEDGSLKPWEEKPGSGSAGKVPESAEVPQAIYFNNFDTADGLTIEGGGSFVDDADAKFGKVFQNATGGMRTNYLLLPENTLAQSATTKEMSIGVWVNAKNAGASADYAWSPLFTAHGAAPIDGKNTFPMFALYGRGTMQINCAGYCDFENEQNVKGTNAIYNGDNDWLADGNWHYYTATMTATTASIYFDGVLKNKWVIDGSSDGQVLAGLFSNGAGLKYIALGGNQAFDYNDPDPGFMFDDFVVYDQALNPSQIATIIANK